MALNRQLIREEKLRASLPVWVIKSMPLIEIIPSGQKDDLTGS